MALSRKLHDVQLNYETKSMNQEKVLETLDNDDSLASNVDSSNSSSNDLSFDDELVLFWRQKFKRNSTFVGQSEWNDNVINSWGIKHRHKRANSIEIILRCLSQNSSQHAADLLSLLIDSNDAIKTMLRLSARDSRFLFITVNLIFTESLVS